MGWATTARYHILLFLCEICHPAPSASLHTATVTSRSRRSLPLCRALKPHEDEHSECGVYKRTGSLFRNNRKTLSLPRFQCRNDKNIAVHEICRKLLQSPESFYSRELWARLNCIINSPIQCDDLFYELGRMWNSVTLPVNIYST